MGKKMLINATLSGEGRVAIVEDGLLTELDIEVAGSENTKGNIYKAEVIRIEPGLQAAFVNYGAQRHGFLQIGDIHPDLWSEDKNDNKQRPPINEILRRGQKILVQVVKEERGTKGAAVTTELSLAGRFMVLMANSRSRGISRKIEKDSTRKKIKEALKELDLPDEMGYIIRTAAIDQPPEELKRDFNYLFNTYKNIIAQAENATAPALIYQESSLVLRSVRDYFTPDMDEVLIDDKEVFKQTREFFKTVMPDQVKLVKLHQERRPIFSRYQIEEQIAQLTSNSVTLPSGGSIVLDQTEALVAIDVNSGKVSSEQNIEATACLVNVEAATEIARQLRLRDLGGLIVIDFIDMRQRKNARKVEKTLELALKQDKARVTQGRISSLFGLLEMSRQRIKPNLGAASYSSCPHCSGSGRVRSSESRAISLLRRIQAGTAKGKIEKVVATVALDVGTMLLNQKRSELRDLELQQHIEVWINPRPDFLPDQVELDFIKDVDEQENGAVEQKALVDINFADRSKDFDFSATATKKQPDTKLETQDSPADPSKNQTDESHDEKQVAENQDAPPQPKPPRRSRPSRHRRPRTSASERNKENSEQPTQAEETPSEAEQARVADTDKRVIKLDPSQHTDAATSKGAQQEDGAQPSSSTRPTTTKGEVSPASVSAISEGEAATTTADKNTSASESKATQTKNAPGDAEAEKPKRRRAPRRPAAKKKEAEAPQSETSITESKTKTSAKTEAALEKKPQSSAAAPAKAAATSAKSTPAPTPAKPAATPDKPAATKKTTKGTSSAAPTQPKTAPAPELAPASTPDLKPAPQQTAQAEPAPADKPAPERKRRTAAKSSAPRRKTSKKETDVTATPEQETEKTADEKKAPRRRTTAARSKATASKAKTGTDEVGAGIADTPKVASNTASATTAATTEEKPAVKRAPRRTTTRRKPAAAKTEAAQTSVAKTDAAPKDTPAAETSKPAQSSQSPRKTTTPKPAVTQKSEDDA